MVIFSAITILAGCQSALTAKVFKSTIFETGCKMQHIFVQEMTAYGKAGSIAEEVLSAVRYWSNYLIISN
jgi:hypothetical protein